MEHAFTPCCTVNLWKRPIHKCHWGSWKSGSAFVCASLGKWKEKRVKWKTSTGSRVKCLRMSHCFFCTQLPSYVCMHAFYNTLLHFPIIIKLEINLAHSKREAKATTFTHTNTHTHRQSLCMKQMHYTFHFIMSFLSASWNEWAETSRDDPLLFFVLLYTIPSVDIPFLTLSSSASI